MVLLAVYVYYLLQRATKLGAYKHLNWVIPTMWWSELWLVLLDKNHCNKIADTLNTPKNK